MGQNHRNYLGCNPGLNLEVINPGYNPGTVILSLFCGYYEQRTLYATYSMYFLTTVKYHARMYVVTMFI